MIPGAEHRYGTYGTPNTPGNLRKFKLKLLLDFPADCDMNDMYLRMQQFCEKYKREAMASRA